MSAKVQNARNMVGFNKALAKQSGNAFFFALLKHSGIQIPETEHRFHPVRKWRFDFAWVAEKVALEVDGGVWKKGGGRHTRGAGWIKDSEKLNAAAASGWRLLRCTPQGLNTAYMIGTIKQSLTQERVA